MRKPKTWVVVVAAVAILGTVLAIAWAARSGEKGKPEQREKTAQEVQVPKQIERRVIRQGKPVLGVDLEDDEDSKRSPAEKRLAAAIEKALDDEDLEQARRCAAEALTCADVEIRQAMVDTLGWFGAKALAELTPFMADADSDVAESARDQWEVGVSEIEDDAQRVKTVSLAMGAMKDEDFLESISGEYIGIDEKLAVEALLGVIEGGGTAEGIAKAKETYEFVTGEEFSDRAGVERWLAEEYHPDNETEARPSEPNN